MNVLLVGPAGSGKSTFAKEFSSFLTENGHDAKVVNLDPASDPIYEACRNLRDFVKTEEIMKEFKLGVNGALIKSMEIATGYLDEVIVEGEYVIYDTPGQMELFLYTDFGERLVEKLRGFTVGVFLIDSCLATSVEKFAACIGQAVVVTLKFTIPFVTMFTKADVCKAMELSEARKEISKAEGVIAEVLENFMNFVDATTLSQRVIRVSSKNRLGFDEVLDVLHEVFCSCGDLS